MKNSKNHKNPPYEPITPDDIRTIPDLYDNLYAGSSDFTGSVIRKVKKNTKKSKNSEDFKENDLDS